MTLLNHRVLIAGATAIVALCVWFLLSWILFLRAPLVSDDQGLKYVIPEGSSIHYVIHDLYLLNVIKHPYLFSLLVTLRHDQHLLKAGEYLFPKGVTAPRLLDQITTGSGMVYHTFTIVAGWSFKHLRRVMDKNPDLQHSSQLSNADIMAKLGHPGVDPEGWFYPDTYFFMKGSSDIALLKRALRMMETKLDEAWKQREPGLPYKTPYDALIAASLIEKETGIEQERAWIAGVIVNRLRKDMLLQIDPTVIYDVGARFDGKIYKEDLLRNTPHNTYFHKGLPPTPIAIPSMDSIIAALHPKHHDYIYFVAKGDADSEHQFSRTFKEHSEAIIQAKKRKYRPTYFNSNLVRYYFMKMALTKLYN